MSKYEEIYFHLKKAYLLGKEIGYKDILDRTKYIEFFAANILNHNYADIIQGEDAIDENGKKVEYKSTQFDQGQFQFPGMTRKKLEKLKEYSNCFFIIKNGPTILKIYKLPIKYIINHIDERLYDDKRNINIWLKKMLSWEPEIVFNNE